MLSGESVGKLMEKACDPPTDPVRVIGRSTVHCHTRTSLSRPLLSPCQPACKTVASSPSACIIGEPTRMVVLGTTQLVS
jgi:hypothetical protein